MPGYGRRNGLAVSMATHYPIKNNQHNDSNEQQVVTTEHRAGKQGAGSRCPHHTSAVFLRC